MPNVHADVARYLARCTRDATGLVPFKALFAGFCESLPAAKRGSWSRTNFLIELGRAGLQIGEFANSDYVLEIAPPGARWQVVNGKAVFQ